MSSATETTAKPRWRGVSHEIAAFVFPVLGAVLVIVAHDAAARWAAVVYTVGVTAMYAASAVYHRGHWTPSTQRRLRRLDHSMILVGIAATYTPVAVVGLDTRSARILLGVVWPLAAAGIVMQLFWLHAPRWLVAGLYVVIGWTARRVRAGALAPARCAHVLADPRGRRRLLGRRTRLRDATTRPQPGRVRIPRGVPHARHRGRDHLLRRDPAASSSPHERARRA